MNHVVCPHFSVCRRPQSISPCPDARPAGTGSAALPLSDLDDDDGESGSGDDNDSDGASTGSSSDAATLDTLPPLPPSPPPGLEESHAPLRVRLPPPAPRCCCCAIRSGSSASQRGENVHHAKRCGYRCHGTIRTGLLMANQV